jgi:hypothetical protein
VNESKQTTTERNVAMSTESMLERLDQYYQSQGIPALGFNCKHRDACSAVCEPGQMVSVPESYVGAEYEAGILPRLLFVSSDTNNPEWLKDDPKWEPCGKFAKSCGVTGMNHVIKNPMAIGIRLSI